MDLIRREFLNELGFDYFFGSCVDYLLYNVSQRRGFSFACPDLRFNMVCCSGFG